MANPLPNYQYKETRVNLESCVPGANVSLRLPSTSHLTSWSSRTSQKRPLPSEIPASEDENAYKHRHLASAGSIYHRQHHKSPRSFLWRILEDGKVLAVRAVDLSKQEKAADSYLTLRFYLPNTIRPTCVAVSDSKDHDTLSVFVLTENNSLYTITLRPEFFCKRGATEDNVADWCKTYSPIGLSNKHPHRLIALTSRELIVTLHDGGFLRLAKRPDSHGAAWDESHYNEGGWGLRSLIPFQGSTTVLSGKVHMELTALTSVAVPVLDIGDTQYLFSVSLGHRLKIWNLETRKIAYDEDILDRDRLPNEIGPYIIQPTHSNLVKVLPDVGGKVVIVTYSPVGLGQFKFWRIEQQIDGALELEDFDFDFKFEPPTPTADIWTLADFFVAADKQTTGKVSLWVLWKNNLIYRVQKVSLALYTPEDIRLAWKEEWVAVANEAIADTPLPIFLPSDAESASQKWLDCILCPGRFTVAIIETALALYEKGMGSKSISSRGTRNIADRICAVIGSTTALGRTTDDLDYEGFQNAVDAQWRRFFRLIMELDKQRGEALSLSYDPEQDLASVVTADGLAVLRDCSAIERIWHNADAVIPDMEEGVNVLVSAASAFSDTFSDELLHSCKTVLMAELFQDISSADSTRLQTYYDSCGFAGQISDDDYAQLLQNLGGSFRVVSQDVYDLFFQAVVSADEPDDRLEQLPLAEFGMKTVIKGVQETIELHRNLCFDQLMLLTFIQGEIDQEEEKFHIDTGVMFTRLLQILRRLELLSWLCKSQITLPLSRYGRSSGSFEKVLDLNKQPEETKTITVLAGSFAHLLGLITHSGSPSSWLLTDMIVRICHPDSEYMLQPVLIQCFLLTIGRSDLAGSLMFFCDQDPFSIYVQGRVHLELKDLSNAATCFRKAAFGLSFADPTLKNSRNSSGLLNDSEWNLLYSGLPKYYSHIVALFDAAQCYSFVIDFSRLALQFFRPKADDADTFDLKTDIQSRLFNATLQTSQFDLAYSTLTLVSDQALKLSSLRNLIVRMCESSSTAQFIELPFLGLQNDVDDILFQRCQGIRDVNAGTPYHHILYAWRIKHNDFRGAASISLERLQKLQNSDNANRALEGVQDGLETAVTRQYLSLINALSCVDEKDAWILSEGVTNTNSPGSGCQQAKRKVVTLEKIRKEYQAELDRIVAIENGQFAFGGDEDMVL